MQREKVEFENGSGTRLAGILERPAGPVQSWALFAHCFTCTKESKAAAYVSGRLADRGIGVLRFDFTGLGASGGEFADSSFTANVGDLVAAATFLEKRHAAPELLVGHSLGGAAAIAAAPGIESCRAVATIGAPADPLHVRKLIRGAPETLDREGAAEVDIGGRPFRISREFVGALERHDLAETLAGLGRALLVLHSPADTVVGIDNATGLFLPARHPKSFVSLDQADHLLTDRSDAAYVADVIAAWASRYLSEAPPRKAEPAEGEAGDGWTIAETPGGEFRTRIVSGRHRLTADEPEDVGGEDAGPSPYDLLAAALATCTGMTLVMYARHKGLALDRVRVGVRHGRIHARDCEDCETQAGKVDVFDRWVSVEGELDDATRARLVEIADRCPVHRTLTSESRVRSEPR
jgi:putative redox protein